MIGDPAERLSSPRIDLVAPEAMDAEQRGLMTETQAQLGLFQLCARHPEVLRRLKATGSFANRETRIAGRDRELMILRMSWLLDSEFEWGQHYDPAMAAGLSPADAERVKVGPDADGWDDWDRGVLSAIDGLVSDCMIPTAAWESLRSRYDEETMLEFVIFFGHYTMVATFANTFGLGTAPGRPGFDGRRDG
ncbi:MAG: carboxymuconolactone decarboxylase family protein [Actinomycetota bacterium]